MKVQSHGPTAFICAPSAQWYRDIPPLEPSGSANAVSATQLAELTSKAANLHAADVKTFAASSSSNSSSSEATFLSKVIQSGTLSDRLSALTLLVQSSPLHNTKALETLKEMSERGKGKGGREESLKALRCIVDWWVGGGAPNRKLKYFRDHLLRHPSVTDQHLLLWYFEDWLKKFFFSVLQILEALSLDPLLFVRTQSLTLISTLLREKPEQEQNLLRLLVNKLGDTEKSLCSRSSYHLLQLLQSHPAMKSVIVREITALVLRPSAPPPSTTSASGKHIRFTDSKPTTSKSKPAEKHGGNPHARYYATITFNQILLTPGDHEVALQLIDVYFEMFKEIIGETAGDNADKDEEPKELKVDKGGRVRDNKKDKDKGHGKTVEHRGAAGFAEVEDGQSRLTSAVLSGVNRALPFAKIHIADSRIQNHLDTLFLIAHTSTFNASLQALVLIQQISSSLDSASRSQPSTSTSTAKSIKDRYYRALYTSLHDPRLATSSKQAMYLNLLFKTLKDDVGGDLGNQRIEAIVRRFVQILVSGGSGATEFVAGGLYLLGELFGTIPGLRSMIKDAPKEEAEQYDPRKRDPQYAHADSSPLWELTPLLDHYHPAVALHARQLLSSQPLTASADLSQNTLSHFLDRFVYKNPKKIKEGETSKGKGASAMQPAASGFDGVKLMKGEVEDQTRVNEAKFLKKRPEDIPVDQLFFYKYFTRKDERIKAKAAKVGRRKGQDDDSDEDSEDEVYETVLDTEAAGSVSEGEGKGGEEDNDLDENSEIDEDEVWKAMQATMPKTTEDDLLDADDDVDSDLELDSEDTEEEGDDDDDDALSLVEASDNDDLVSLSDDVDIPGGLIEYDGSDASDGEGVDEEWGGIGGSNKRKRNEKGGGGKRKKLKSLPTFASYEDYAKLIEDGAEDDL